MAKAKLIIEIIAPLLNPEQKKIQCEIEGPENLLMEGLVKLFVEHPKFRELMNKAGRQANEVRAKKDN